MLFSSVGHGKTPDLLPLRIVFNPLRHARLPIVTTIVIVPTIVQMHPRSTPQLLLTPAHRSGKFLTSQSALMSAPPIRMLPRWTTSVPLQATLMLSWRS